MKRLLETSIPFRLTICLAVFALLGSAGAGLRSEKVAVDATSELRPGMPVELVELRMETSYPVRELHVGRIVSRRVSELGFERSGRLVEVTRDQGDSIQAGELLARLDTRELEARRRELVAQRRRIEADLALARSTTRRRQELHRTGVLSSQRLDETVYAQEALESQLLAASAAIEHVDVQLALSRLHAPFAGVLADRFADEGTVLRPGAPVLRLLEGGALEVHVGVPLGAAARLPTGSLHTIEVAGVELEGRLDTLLPTVDPETRTLTAVFRLENPPAGIRHGALARVALESRVESRGFWVPLSSLAEARRGLWAAYVAVASNAGLIAERRQVEVIHSEADRAFVRGTLFDGDRVVAGGVHRIVPGMRLRASAGG